jgi:hypothetical protein
LNAVALIGSSPGVIAYQTAAAATTATPIRITRALSFMASEI